MYMVHDYMNLYTLMHSYQHGLYLRYMHNMDRLCTGNHLIDVHSFQAATQIAEEVLNQWVTALWIQEVWKSRRLMPAELFSAAVISCKVKGSEFIVKVESVQQ